ncbi:MAG: hypothetical protein E4H20_04010 [Spirochaetales bacterium]|nr:MAG: hypothetical protein E4H20_04010 [Spirochaetales bacterium]
MDLGPEARRCPLCGTEPEAAAANQDSGAASDSNHRTIADTAVELQQPARVRRYIAAEMLTVCLAIAAATVFLVDLMTGGGITWSLYPLASLGFVWCFVYPYLVSVRRPSLGIAVAALSPLAYMVAMDYINGTLDWSLRLGIPIALTVEATLAGIVLAIRLSKRRGLNVLSYSLLAIALICLVTEASISLWAIREIHLLWSYIVASALVPVAAFLLYAHHRLARDTSLRKLFHI